MEEETYKSETGRYMQLVSEEVFYLRDDGWLEIQVDEEQLTLTPSDVADLIRFLSSSPRTPQT